MNIEQSQYSGREDYGVIKIHLWKEINFALEVLGIYEKISLNKFLFE